ncbi:MAG: hypothetical protein Q7W45_13310 [Bacteroidota bacterium]|nr:hypothetical protein [Bacteroidota bacterium]MDP3144501.1 hypothetical protein [Bacteroidota bacterium]MDP3555818.1 hypothetical protein [Bacteroidota bacterium]
MENNYSDQFVNDLAPLPEKPQFLKVLCILSFVACGLFILIYGVGSFALAIGEDTISKVWDQVLASQPQLEEVNPVEFFHEVGKLCLYNLFTNIFSLIGVILMWRLNKIGFFIYIAAELATNFLGLDLDIDGGTKSSLSMIFSIAIDLVFIGMYAVNLKHMNKSKLNS